jgi:hypothetical protein
LCACLQAIALPDLATAPYELSCFLFVFYTFGLFKTALGGFEPPTYCLEGSRAYWQSQNLVLARYPSCATGPYKKLLHFVLNNLPMEARILGS